MSKADTVAFEYAKEKGTVGLDYNQIYDAVKHGYHQAGKDLELTLDDVEIIINAFLDFCIENNERGKKKRCTDKEYSQEVLKRFNKERKEKSC